MPCIWELLYDGDSSDFFASKTMAERVNRMGDNEGTLIRHDYEPTQKGIASLLNRVANQASGDFAKILVDDP